MMLKSHILLCVALALVAPSATADEPVVEIPGAKISDHLLMPWFKVDPEGTARSLFSVQAASGTPELAHVQVWTGYDPDLVVCPSDSELTGRCYLGGPTVSLPPLGVKSFDVATLISTERFLCDNGEFPGTVIDPAVYDPAFDPETDMGTGWIEIRTVSSCAVVPPGHDDYPAVKGDLFGFYALLDTDGGAAQAAPFVEARAGVFHVKILTGGGFTGTRLVAFGDSVALDVYAVNEQGTVGVLPVSHLWFDGPFVVDVGKPVEEGGWGLTGFGTIVLTVTEGKLRAGAFVEADRYSEFIPAVVTDPAEAP